MSNVFNAHPGRPAADYEDVDGHGRALPRRKGSRNADRFARVGFIGQG